MIIDKKRFIEVKPTDTVEDVIERLNKHLQEQGESAIWLVVALMPPWQYSVVKVNKLYEVQASDWNKSLEEAIGGWFQRSDAIFEGVLANNPDLAKEMALHSPSKILIVHKPMELHTEGQLTGDCDSRCPNCDWIAYDSVKNSWITCHKCKYLFRATCDA